MGFDSPESLDHWMSSRQNKESSYDSDDVKQSPIQAVKNKTKRKTQKKEGHSTVDDVEHDTVQPVKKKKKTKKHGYVNSAHFGTGGAIRKKTRKKTRNSTKRKTRKTRKKNKKKTRKKKLRGSLK